MSAIGYALLSLAFAALLEVSYKRYSMRARSRGIYVAGIGVVWGIAQVGIALWSGEPLSWSALGLAFGLAAGITVAASNILLIESLTQVDVSLGSTIYRLNTIGVVVLSFLFLGEALGPVKLAAIAFGVAAALTLYGDTRRSQCHILVRSYFWLAVFASSLRAAFGVISKAALEYGVSSATILITSALCWVVGGLAYARIRERGLRITADNLGYALLSGILVILVVNTLIQGLRLGDATTVIPIANLSFVVALGISLAWKMEHWTPRKLVALSFAAACVWLMSVTV